MKGIIIRREKVRSHEKGLLFKDKQFKGILDAGSHWFLDFTHQLEVDLVSMRTPWLFHMELEAIVKSGALDKDTRVLDLTDNQRALVWIEGRFKAILRPGLYALWNTLKDVRVEIIEADEVRFTHKDQFTIARADGADKEISSSFVENGWVGLYFKDGRYIETLDPGQHLFWKNAAKVTVRHVDMRESILDISGQEIMTADKVSLRMNAMVNYRVTDAVKAATVSDDYKQALYREAQLALRAVVGTYETDALLTEKEKVATDLKEAMKDRASELGGEIIGLGIRDVILPGDMKELMNKVMEAKKAADANLITRREETAAMRSQVNTAKLLENNPTLMRLRELDVLERVAGNSKMNLVLGEKGLADRIINLL